jgi:hypothetical protein
MQVRQSAAPNRIHAQEIGPGDRGSSEKEKCEMQYGLMPAEKWVTSAMKYDVRGGFCATLNMGNSPHQLTSKP